MMAPFDSWDEEDDRDLPQEQDLAADESGELPEMACPECGGWVTEDTQKCPQCGNWITAIEPRSGGRGIPRWVYVGAVILMLLAMLRFVL